MFGLDQQGLLKSKHLLLGPHHMAFEHDEVIGHLTIMDKATQWVDALVRQVIVSRCIVLDQFAILDEVALTNLVNLLVNLCSVIVAFLPSLSHMGRVPGSNTSNFGQTSMGLLGQFLCMPMTGLPFVPFAFCHADDINHLILPKHLVHRNLLLQPFSGSVLLLSHSAPIHLDLHQVCLLLARRKQTHLSAGNYAHDLAVFLHAVENLLQLFLAHVLVPFLTVFGESLLRFVPILTEKPFMLITDMLSNYGLEGPEASWALHISHDVYVSIMVTASRTSFLFTLDPGLSTSQMMWVMAALYPRKAVRSTSLEASSLGKLFTFP